MQLKGYIACFIFLCLFARVASIAVLEHAANMFFIYSNNPLAIQHIPQKLSCQTLPLPRRFCPLKD